MGVPVVRPWANLGRTWARTVRFARVRALVIEEGRDPDKRLVVYHIPLNKPGPIKVRQERVHIALIEREHRGFDAPRPVLEPSLAVGDRPESGK